LVPGSSGLGESIGFKPLKNSLFVMIPRSKALLNRLKNNELILPIVKNAGYLFSATGITSAMSFVQSVLAGRVLGPTSFGVLAALFSFTSVVNMFASFRMNELVVRYVGYYQENDDPQRATAIIKLAGLMEISSSIFAFLLVYFLAPLGARFFAHDPSLVTWFQIYGMIVLANMVYETSLGLLQILDRFRIIAVLDVISNGVSLLLILIAFITKQEFAAFVIAYMSGKILRSVAVSISAMVEASRTWGREWWRSPLKTLKPDFRSVFTFAISTNISGTISLISKNSETLWVSAFIGTKEAGYYKIAMSLAGILQLPVAPLPKATYPALAREIARKKWRNVKEILRQGSLLASAYSIPVTVVLVIFGKLLIDLTYGSAYLPTYDPLIILLIGFTFVNIFYWNRAALLALARPVFPTIVNFVGMIIKVSCIFLFVPRWGYLVFAGLLAGYYIFTVGVAALRVAIDINRRSNPEIT
jgi:O-antigen/teichoic acid export membrane protein